MTKKKLQPDDEHGNVVPIEKAREKDPRHAHPDGTPRNFRGYKPPTPSERDAEAKVQEAQLAAREAEFRHVAGEVSAERARINAADSARGDRALVYAVANLVEEAYLRRMSPKGETAGQWLAEALQARWPKHGGRVSRASAETWLADMGAAYGPTDTKELGSRTLSGVVTKVLHHMRAFGGPDIQDERMIQKRVTAALKARSARMHKS